MSKLLIAVALFFAVAGPATAHQFENPFQSIGGRGR
jgi:hypothetical protein